MISENEVRTNALSLIQRYPVHAASVALALAIDEKRHGDSAAAADAMRVVQTEMAKID